MIPAAVFALDRLTIRRLTAADVGSTLAVFREAVRRGAAEHYSAPERQAWAPSVIEAGVWRARRLAHASWVAEIAGQVVGFSELTDGGELGMLYVHPDHTRRGYGRALVEETERAARACELTRLVAHASLLAEPLLARLGFELVHREAVELAGQRLVRALMQKQLEP